MFLCDDCLKGSCDGLHLSSSFGPCEGCGETKGTWDCIHYKAKGDEAKSLSQVQLAMLAHLRDLARKLHRRRRPDVALFAKMECAREMCQIAGIPEAIIADYSTPKLTG